MCDNETSMQSYAIVVSELKIIAPNNETPHEMLGNRYLGNTRITP
jgi:hypothetical protein